MKQTNYKTKQKTAILQCVEQMGDKHFTIDIVCEKLSSKGDSAGRTTVYRHLESLTKEGILRKFVMPQGESACYQYVGEHVACHEHFHLKCEKCGNLIHMQCEEMNSIAEHIKSHHGFVLDPLKTVIYGICEDCALR